jgi:hypothetical protein
MKKVGFPVGIGYFLEDKEVGTKSVFKKIEEKKLLSTVQNLGLLSKAEAAGFTLSKIEKLGLLSTAERLGLLGTAEDLLQANPATVASGALPLVVAALVAFFVIPHDNDAEMFVSTVLALVFAGAATTTLAGGFLLAALQEE